MRYQVLVTPSKSRKKVPRTRVKRKVVSGIKKKKRTRTTEISVWREWLVPDGAYHRYKGLRGVYWYWLSRDVRKTEWEKYGICITCLMPIEDWKQADCGHIISADSCGEYLRFHRLNLTIQHKKCNNPRFTPGAGVLNSIHMEQRHGVGTMEKLIGLMAKDCKRPTEREYRELIIALPSYQEALNLRKDVLE